MKIAFIARRFAFDQWGGTEHVVFESAQALHAAGHHVDILATSACSQPGHEQRNGIDIYRFSYAYPRWGLSKEQRARLDKKGGDPVSHEMMLFLRKGNYDLIHAHTLGHLAGRAKLIAESQHIPLILSLHGGQLDVPENEQQSLTHAAGKSFHYGRLTDMLLGAKRDATQACDGLICVGYGEYEAQRKRFEHKKMIYLGNSVDVEAFAGAPTEDFRKQYTISRTDRVILCVSRIDPQKNQMMLLKAFEKMHANRKDTTLVLIGPVTDEAYCAELKAYAEEKNLTYEIRIIPGLKPEDPMLKSAYLQSDVFVLPSRHEPFGIVILEAWAAKLPVIASSVGGIRYLIEDSKTGVLFSTQEELETLLINGIADDAQWGKQFIEPAYEQVKNLYSVTGVTRRLIDFYNEVRREL